MDQYIKICSIKISELCFYCFFILLLFAKGIGLYDGQALFKIFLLAALAGWLCKQCLTYYTVKEACVTVFLVILGGIIYINTHEKGALFAILLVSGMKGISVKKIFHVGFITWILSFGTLFLLTSLHIADSSFKVHDKFGMGRIIRWSLGYAHPNVLHISFFVLVCFIGYLLQDRFKIRHFIALEMLNIYVFMYSLSSTGFLAVTFFLGLLLYWSIRKHFCMAEKILIQLCLPFCLLLSLVAPVTLKEPLFSLINKIVNNRMVLSKWFLQNQPGRLLGVDTREIVTSLRTMDNSYVFAYITYGLIFTVLFSVFYFIVIYQRVKNQDGLALCIILSCLVAGITEPFLFNTSFKNLSMIFIGNMLYAKEDKAKSGSLLGKFDRELEFKIPDITKAGNNIGQTVKGYRKKMLTAAVFLGIIIGLISCYSMQMPKRYIMPRTAFEETGDIEEVYHLKSVNDIPGEGDIILGYVNEDTDMVPFAGNIAVVEKFRNTVAVTVITTILIYGMEALYLWRKKNGA